MTLQNGLIHNRRALLWTDTALWNAKTGEQLGEITKAWEGTTWPWAATLSGTFATADPYRIQLAIAGAWPQNPAELIECTRDALGQEAIAGHLCRVLLAFPCPDYGARMFMIAADRLPFAEPFEPYETVEYMSSGNGSAYAGQFAGKDMTPAKMRRFIDYQISNPGESNLGWPSRIGGNVVELKVTGEGVSHRVVREIDGAVEAG